MISSYYLYSIQWLENHLISCPSRKYLHMECPGCGFQRSVLLLLQGEIRESVRMYPATLPILMLVVFSLLHLNMHFTRGALIIKYLYILVAIVILVFYIYKILNHKILI